MSRLPALERAYELARSGSCASVSEIGVTLDREGYAHVREQLDGPVLRADLNRICKDAQQLPPLVPNASRKPRSAE